MLFSTQIAGARLRASQHDLAITCFYARSYAVSVLVIRVGGSLQTVVKMFTDVLRTSACCISCWRGDGRVHRAMLESGARVPPHCLEAVHSRLRAAQVVQV